MLKRKGIDFHPKPFVRAGLMRGKREIFNRNLRLVWVETVKNKSKKGCQEVKKA